MSKRAVIEIHTHNKIPYRKAYSFDIVAIGNPSGTKLRTVAASNSRDHARNLSYYCLLALHI